MPPFLLQLIDTRCVFVISVCDPVLGDHGSMVRFIQYGAFVYLGICIFYCCIITAAVFWGVFSVLGGLFVICLNSDSRCFCISHTDMAFFKGFASPSVIEMLGLCFVIPSRLVIPQYVPQNLYPVYKNKVVPVADIITPNQFEAE